MTTENRRVQMTKALLTEAMIELCERGETIARISVSELCAIADVNRSTFYKYYTGPEDLFRETEGRFFGELTSSMRRVAGADSDIAAGMREMCGYLEKNKRAALVVINNNSDPNFPEKLFAIPALKDNADRFILQRFGTKLNEKRLKYIYLFFVYGGYNLMRVWLNSPDPEPAEEIAETIVTLLNGFDI